MSPFDSAGRIHKKAFLVSSLSQRVATSVINPSGKASNLVLYFFCMTSTIARFYVRVHVQRQFSIDDGILLIGVACLTAATALLITFVDKLYLIVAADAGVGTDQLPSDFIPQAFEFQKLVTIALVLTWCSIVSVKFSYLFLFKRLVSRIRPLVIFWWFTLIANAAISVYGAIVYGVVCPYYYSLKALQCAVGEGRERIFSFSVSQMVLDIVGDLLILYIPFRLIWKIKIKLSQKIALSLCLCLTTLTILCTVTRVAGIHTGHRVQSIDSIWETYWQFVAANIALMMTAATAFRTFFISGFAERESPSSQSDDRWYTKGKRLMRDIIPHSWRSKRIAGSSSDRSNSIHPLELHLQAPRPNMTGIQTFINGQGKTSTGGTQYLYTMAEEEHGDPRTLARRAPSAQSIMVQRDIAVTSEKYDSA